MRRKPRTRRHLALFEVKVSRFPKGILSALPITRTEIRLGNTGKDYAKAKGLGTSRVKRAMRAAVLAYPHDAVRQSFGPFRVVDLLRAGVVPAAEMLKASRLARRARGA